MTQNTTGIPLNVTKDPQCRHSDKQGFVSYAFVTTAGVTYVTASCSNCGSSGAAVAINATVGHSIEAAEEKARNALMLIEADEL